MKIRRIQYAPESPPRTGLQTLITKSFIGCYGSIELEATLDKRVRFLILEKLIYNFPSPNPEVLGLKIGRIDLGPLAVSWVHNNNFSMNVCENLNIEMPDDDLISGT